MRPISRDREAETRNLRVGWVRVALVFAGFALERGLGLAADFGLAAALGRVARGFTPFAERFWVEILAAVFTVFAPTFFAFADFGLAGDFGLAVAFFRLAVAGPLRFLGLAAAVRFGVFFDPGVCSVRRALMQLPVPRLPAEVPVRQEV